MIFGSDVDSNGVYLEAHYRASGKIVRLSFFSDVDGVLSFIPHDEDLPVGFVEWFKAESKRRLPPAEA